jgi:glutaconyl-CoA/methylmalonyl-CoA decarboxylase subunit gamma
MRVTLARDGRKEEVEVGPDLDAVLVGGTSYPVKVVSSSEMRVELEIAGEKVVVENWPDHFPTPPGLVDVNGERWRVGVERTATEARPTRSMNRSALGSPPPAAVISTPPASAPTSAGVPVIPSMPGRVVELRVKEGDRVRKGDVLVVLEAMKMRNELGSPADGIVRGIRVAAGESARPSEPMMFVATA